MAAFTPSRLQISRFSVTCCVLSLAVLLSSCAGFPTLYKLHPQAADSHTYSYYPYVAGAEDENLIADYNNYNLRNSDQSNNYNSYNLPSAANSNNQWSVAQDPAAAMYELPEDYYTGGGGAEPDPETQWAEIETLSNLLDMYDALNAEQQQQEPPTWGHIVNEEPAAELELEELKHKKKPDVAPKPKIPQPSVKFQESKVTTPAAPITPKSGQKEIPLLRPPVAAGSKAAAASTGVVSQRSDKASAPAAAAAGKKTSPYDTLRKYLTLEDALKKEAEKRRAEVHTNAGASRQKKSSGFVADAESLTSQLNNLKKSVA